MPLIPPLEPNTIRASIVFIFNTKASLASHKLLPGPLHHVLVVLGFLVVQEGDGGERGGLGSRIIHCGECSHPLLHWTCGLDSVILNQGCGNKLLEMDNLDSVECGEDFNSLLVLTAGVSIGLGVPADEGEWADGGGGGGGCLVMGADRSLLLWLLSS